jgi:signal transduction histidine kinase
MTADRPVPRRYAALVGRDHNRSVVDHISGDGRAHVVRSHALALRAALAAAFGAATIVVIRATKPWSTTYSGASIAGEAADLMAGLGLIAAGLLIRYERPSRGTGLLGALAGTAWLAGDWIGWQDGSPLARSVAMVAAPFFAPLVLHLVVRFPGGGLASNRSRAAVAAGYVAVAMVSLASGLFRDPRSDPHCWNNCTDDVFLLSAQAALARGLEVAGLCQQLGVGLAVAMLCMRRLAVASVAARRVLMPVLLPGVLVGGALVAHAVVLLRSPLEGPEFVTSSALFQLRAWSAAALGLGLAWSAIRERNLRIAVARLAADLGAAPVPGALATALAQATNDPSLEMGYWVERSGRFVDSAGRTVDTATARAGRAATGIVRNGSPVAVVVHDATAVSPGRLRAAMGAAASLAVDNERLQADVVAQLADLRASRARIVEAGDAERRRLERNLHDGAQQHLLALSYDVGSAAVAATGHAEMEQLVGAAADKVREALAELRVLAHGIYPAILTEGGLALALLSLADSALVPVAIGGVPDERFPEPVERAVYLVVADAVERGSRSAADQLRVRVSVIGQRLTVEIDGAGPGPYTHSTDRLGALGGVLVSEPGLLRAEIPCG